MCKIERDTNGFLEFCCAQKYPTGDLLLSLSATKNLDSKTKRRLYFHGDEDIAYMSLTTLTVSHHEDCHCMNV